MLRRRIWLGAAAVFAASLAAVTMPVAPIEAAPGEGTTPYPNPDLDRQCGLDILVILDESQSIESAGATEDVRRAFRAFTAALQNTGSSMAVVDFNTVARIPIPTYTTVTTATRAILFDPYIAGFRPEGRTNWEDGFRVGRYFAPRPTQAKSHLVVFITDGDPNTVIDNNRVSFDPGNPDVDENEYELRVPLSNNQTSNQNENSATTPAISNANALKFEGSKILAVAVGNALSSQQSLNRLVKVSGPDIYDGDGEFDIATDDIFRVDDFDRLEDALREAAFALCAPSVTIEKLVDDTPDPDTDDARPGVGWDIEAEVTAPGGFDWVLPDGATGDTATVATDGAGFASFQWLPAAAGDSTIVVTEEDPVPLGYVNDPSATSCVSRTPDRPDDEPLDIDVGDGTFSAVVADESIVTCTLVNRAEPAPAILLEKATNGSTADAPPPDPGVPYIPVGGVVIWTYVVTNDGNVTLDIELEDDQLGPVTCPAATLAPGDSMTCTATGTAVAGVYTNLGTVTGTDPFGTIVEATDPSSYIGTVPGIEVEKFTIRVATGDREDADDAPGLFIPVGEDVTWEYEITNSGTTPLENVVLEDNVVGPVDCGLDPTDTIPPGGTVTCTVAATAAVAGQYENVAQVTADDTVGGATVFDSDPSHYFGEILDLTIEKSTNGVDADTPPGPRVTVGDRVTWIYQATNNGNVPIFGWSITDSELDALACPRIGIIAPGNTVTCHASGVAEPGQYQNTATVFGTVPSGAGVTDDDPSHYLGVTADLIVEKLTNGEDADGPTGPFVPVDGPVTWTYEVTTTGTDPVMDVAVDDSDGLVDPVAVEAGGFNVGDTNQNGLLEPAETWLFTAAGTAVPDQYSNLALGLGSGVTSGLVGDLDPSHYFGADSGIDIEKATDGVDADLPAEAVLVRVGDPVVWSFEVTNTGNDTLTGLTVVDDRIGAVACPVTTLAPGDATTCTASGTAEVGLHANVATATATDGLGATVTDSDPSHHRGVRGGIVIEKSTNGEDADEVTGPRIAIGDPVTWTYEVSAVDLAVRYVEVVDDQGVVPVYASGDEDGDETLDVGERWVYRAEGIAELGQYGNVGVVTGLDQLEVAVTDADPSHYLGIDPVDPEQLVPDIEIEKSPDTATVAIWSTHTFTIRVTNTGGTDLTGVEVTDAATPTCNRDIGDLALGESVSYVCSVQVTTGFTNTAVVEGVGPSGSVVDAEDSAVVILALPVTGSETGGITLAGVVMLLLGAALVRLAGAPRPAGGGGRRRAG